MMAGGTREPQPNPPAPKCGFFSEKFREPVVGPHKTCTLRKLCPLPNFAHLTTDIVLFPTYPTTDVTVNGKKHLSILKVSIRLLTTARAH
jgi:hypothetical protein